METDDSQSAGPSSRDSRPRRPAQNSVPEFQMLDHPHPTAPAVLDGIHARRDILIANGTLPPKPDRKKKKSNGSSRSAAFMPFKPGNNTMGQDSFTTSTPRRKISIDMPNQRTADPKPGLPFAPPPKATALLVARGPLPPGSQVHEIQDLQQQHQNGYLRGQQSSSRPVSGRMAPRYRQDLEPEHLFAFGDDPEVMPREPYDARSGGGHVDRNHMRAPQTPHPNHVPQSYIQSGDSSSFVEPAPHNRHHSSSSSPHYPTYSSPADYRHTRNTQHTSSNSILIADSESSDQDLAPWPPVQNSSPTRNGAFGAHGRPPGTNGHNTSRMQTPARSSFGTKGSQSPQKWHAPLLPPPIAPATHKKRLRVPPGAYPLNRDDETSEVDEKMDDVISDPDGFDLKDAGIVYVGTGPAGNAGRKGKEKAAPAETPSHERENGSKPGGKSKVPYVELREQPTITAALRSTAVPDTTDSKVRKMAQEYEGKRGESGRRESGGDTWDTVDGPSKHDLRIRGTASRSKSPEKRANDTASSKKLDRSVAKPYHLIPSSLKDHPPQTPKASNGPQAQVAGIERAWMYLNDEISIPLSLELVHVAIERQSLVFYSKRGPDMPRVPVDMVEITRGRWFATPEQSLLWVEIAFQQWQTLRSFIEMTRPHDYVKRTEKPKLTVILRLEKGDNAFGLVDFFSRWAKPMPVEKLDEEMANIILAQGLVDNRTTTRNLARKPPFLFDLKPVEAGPSKSTPRSNAQRAKREDVEQLSTRSKPKPRKPNEDDPLQQKLPYGPADPSSSKKKNDRPTAPPRRSGRRSGAGLLNYNESDDASDVPKPSTVKPLPAAEKNVLLFDYPLNGKAVVQITKGERHRVDNGDFLNDILVEFGLRQVLKGLKPEILEKVHLFNSFFYNKISDKKTKIHKPDPDIDKDHKEGDLDPWPGYDSVKKWTKRAEIFKKDFLIVPINEEFHWYLAIIYRPSGILKERSQSPASSGAKPEPERNPLLEDYQSPPPPIGSPAPATTVNSEDQVDSAPELEASKEADQSMDPLDTLHGDPEYGEPGPEDVVGKASHDMRRLSIVNSSPTRDTDGDVELSEVVGTTEDKPLVQSSPAHNILDGDDCWIFTFDSLGGAHRAVSTHLNKWLEYEANDKLRTILKRPRAGKYVEAKVPSQPNFSDCGLFLVHYTKQLLNNSDETLRFIQRSAPRYKAAERAPWEADMKSVWKEDETKNLRKAWMEDIDMITGRYRSIHDIKPSEPPEPPKPEVEKTAKSAPPEMPSTQESVMVIDPPPPGPSTRGASADPRPSTQSPLVSSHRLPQTDQVGRTRYSAGPSPPRHRSVPLSAHHIEQADEINPVFFQQMVDESEQDLRLRIGSRQPSVSRTRASKSPSVGNRGNIYPFDGPTDVVREGSEVQEMVEDEGSPDSRETTSTDLGGGYYDPRREAHEVRHPIQESPFDGLGTYHQPSEKPGFYPSSPEQSTTPRQAISSTLPPRITRASGLPPELQVASDDDIMHIDPALQYARAPSTEEEEPVEEKQATETPVMDRTPRTRASAQAQHQLETSPLSSLSTEATEPRESPDSPVLPPPAPGTVRRQPSPFMGTAHQPPTRTYGSKQKKRPHASPSLDTPTNAKAKKRRGRTLSLNQGDNKGDESDEVDQLAGDVDPRDRLSGEPKTKQQRTKPLGADAGTSVDAAIVVDESETEDQ